MIKYEDYIKAVERQNELLKQVKDYIRLDNFSPYVDPNTPDGVAEKYEELLSYNEIVKIGDILFA